MIRCNNCGADIEETQTQCPYCHAMQYEASEKEYMNHLYKMNDTMDGLDENANRYIRNRIICHAVITLAAVAAALLVGTEEGCSLIAQNAHKFGLDNIQVVHGSAAGVLEELPAPDAVFVGGSGGELEDIFKIILKKNPHVRIVITAVTLETVQEAVRLLEQNGFDTPQIVQIAVTEVKKRGQYHMLSANNPVFIIEGSSVR